MQRKPFVIRCAAVASSVLLFSTYIAYQTGSLRLFGQSPPITSARPRLWSGSKHAVDVANVGYDDVHVDYAKRPDVGTMNDNIWINANQETLTTQPAPPSVIQLPNHPILMSGSKSAIVFPTSGSKAWNSPSHILDGQNVDLADVHVDYMRQQPVVISNAKSVILEPRPILMTSSKSGAVFTPPAAPITQTTTITSSASIVQTLQPATTRPSTVNNTNLVIPQATPVVTPSSKGSILGPTSQPAQQASSPSTWYENFQNGYQNVIQQQER